MALLEGVRAALVTAVADIDAHVADSAMEREIALAAVERLRADAAGESGAALTAFVEADAALWDLVERYAARIDVARAVGHASAVAVPARRPTIDLDDAPRPPSAPGAVKATTRPAAAQAPAPAPPAPVEQPPSAIEPRRPAFRLRDGETSGAQRAWEHLVKAGGAVSTAAIAAAAGISYNAAAIACRKWREGGFVVGHHAGWRLPGAPGSPAKSLDQVAERVIARSAVPASDGFDGDDGRTHSEADLPPLPSESSIKVGPTAAQTTMLGRTATPPGCPCCGQRAMKAGVRCAACAISCKRTGDTWRRGKMCPAGRRAVEVLEESDDESVGSDDLEGVVEIANERPPRRAPAGFGAAKKVPPPIPTGGNGSAKVAGRPAGLRVDPVAPPRVGEELRKAVKVDPIAAVSGGARGGGLLL